MYYCDKLNKNIQIKCGAVAKVKRQQQQLKQQNQEGKFQYDGNPKTILIIFIIYRYIGEMSEAQQEVFDSFKQWITMN